MLIRKALAKSAFCNRYLLSALIISFPTATLSDVLTFTPNTNDAAHQSAGVLKYDDTGAFITDELSRQRANASSTWKAQSDEYLTDVIKRWGKEAGYTVIATGVGAWQIKVPVTKVGSFKEALEHVIKGFSSQGHPPSVRVFSNKVIKIGSAL